MPEVRLSRGIVRWLQLTQPGPAVVRIVVSHREPEREAQHQYVPSTTVYLTAEDLIALRDAVETMIRARGGA